MPLALYMIITKFPFTDLILILSSQRTYKSLIQLLQSELNLHACFRSKLVLLSVSILDCLIHK